MHHDDPCPPAATPGVRRPAGRAAEPFVAKAVARIERGGKANAVVRPGARRSRSGTSVQTDGLG
jgi:hypothetical protein